MTSTPRSRIIDVSDLEWQDRLPGIRAKSVWEDPATHRHAALMRIEPGASVARHRHVGDEIVFVIEGAIADEFGHVTSGNVGYRPDGCVHTVSSVNGATVLAIITGKIEPVAGGPAAAPSRVVNLYDLPWVDTRPGVRQKRIWEDPAGGRRALLARFEPGATLPPHRHVGDELIYVVEGANADESGAVTTKNGATVLAVVWGRTEPV